MRTEAMIYPLGTQLLTRKHRGRMGVQQIMPYQGVRYVNSRSAPSSRDGYTPREDLRYDGQSQGPIESVRDSARPGIENNRAPPRNSIEEARRQTRDKNERLRLEKEMSSSGGRAPRLREYVENAQQREREVHERIDYERNMKGGSGVSGGASAGRGLSGPFNRYGERTSAEQKVRFVDDSEPMQEGSSDHTSGGGLGRKPQSHSVFDRHSYLGVRSEQPRSGETNSTAASTAGSEDRPIPGTFPAPQINSGSQPGSRAGGGTGPIPRNTHGPQAGARARLTAESRMNRNLAFMCTIQ